MQSWTAGSQVVLSLPAGTFTDPQGQALSLRATQSNGAALPAWLTFNPATATFLGTAPAAAQALFVRVTATDASGLSATDMFTASIHAATNHGLALADWQQAIGPQPWMTPPPPLSMGHVPETHAPMPLITLPHAWHG